MSNTDQGFGQFTPEIPASDASSIAFIIQRALAKVRTAIPVQVNKCSNTGGVSPIGTVEVTPLVKMLDGNGNVQAHGQIFNIPYVRFQGGENAAIIMDPAAGDVGLMVICDRDISSVQENVAAANPGSLRKHDLADGIYVGMCLSKKTPKCYIQFDGQGNLTIQDNNNNKFEMKSDGIDLTPATQVKVTGNLVISGNLELSGTIEGVGGGTYGGALKTSGNIIAGFGGGDQVGLQSHVHGGVTPGGGVTAAPTAGT